MPSPKVILNVQANRSADIKTIGSRRPRAPLLADSTMNNAGAAAIALAETHGLSWMAKNHRVASGLYPVATDNQYIRHASTQNVTNASAVNPILLALLTCTSDMTRQV